ncbi:MAG: ammonium transporter [Planctomycetota bacterium]
MAKSGGRIGWLLLLFAAMASSAGASESMDAAFIELHTKLDYVWVFVCATLVFLMQAGFMALESGMSRAKNSINVAIKNMADFLIAIGSFWVVGFGLMSGVSQGGWYGSSEFCADKTDRPWLSVFFLFQAMFCGTAATIDSGAIAERTKFASYLLISVATSALIYPVFGHWVWRSLYIGETKGWLEAMGFIDFAGSTVVHCVGGWIALAGVLVVGPRAGKFEGGKVRKIHPHSLPLVYLGTFILIFGWLGFNCGSTLTADNSIAAIAVNTLIAATFGGLVAAGLSWLIDGHPGADMAANGALSGLVGITAGCASLTTPSAVIIGVIAGALFIVSSRFIEQVCKLDDVVGAISVHGVCGVWGTIAVALLMPQSALSEGMTRWDQVMVQCLGAGTAFLWAFGIAMLIMAGSASDRHPSFASGGARRAQCGRAPSHLEHA